MPKELCIFVTEKSNAMKIYTKTGDAGTTSLVGGTRVSKAHPRVMTYGDLDELISVLGLLRCETAGQELPLRRIQIHLMNVSAHLANDGRSTKLKPLDEGETAESGTHDELMKLHGQYYELYQLQFRANSGIM